MNQNDKSQTLARPSLFYRLTWISIDRVWHPILPVIQFIIAATAIIQQWLTFLKFVQQLITTIICQVANYLSDSVISGSKGICA